MKFYWELLCISCCWISFVVCVSQLCAWCSTLGAQREWSGLEGKGRRGDWKPDSGVGLEYPGRLLRQGRRRQAQGGEYVVPVSGLLQQADCMFAESHDSCKLQVTFLKPGYNWRKEC
jgi:hypothetical protein